jgi:outer membrane protein assembly factor BamB
MRTSLGVPLSYVLVFLVPLLLFLSGTSTLLWASQPESLSVAWEKPFPKKVDWYVRTSSGVLLIRAGKTLYAIDGKDGRELWSNDRLEIRRGRRGRNLLEIPGTPVLLAKREWRGRTDAIGSLLAVDLWTGKELFLEGRIEHLLGVVPLYQEDRLMLVTGPDIPFKPRIQFRPLFDHAFEKADWKQKYPLTIAPAGENVTVIGLFEINGELYVQIGHTIGRLDLKNGKRGWKFEKGYFGGGSGRVPLRFVEDRIFVAGKDIFALDALTLKPLWTAKKLDWIYDLVVDNGVVFASGKKGAVALDASTGEIRWRVETEKGATNIIRFKEENLLVLADKTGLVSLDMDSGETVAREKLNLEDRVVFLRKVGPDFLLASTGKDVVLLKREALEPIWIDEAPSVAFAAVDYLVCHPRPKLGSVGTWGELRLEKPGIWSWLVPSLLGVQGKGFGRVTTYQPSQQTQHQLQNARGLLEHRALEHAPLQAILQRLHTQSEKDVPRMPVYGTEVGENKWKLWRVDPSSGRRQEWFLNGAQPDIIVGFGLAYAVSGDTLRAFRLTGLAH